MYTRLPSALISRLDDQILGLCTYNLFVYAVRSVRFRIKSLMTMNDFHIDLSNLKASFQY